MPNKRHHEDGTPGQEAAAGPAQQPQSDPRAAELESQLEDVRNRHLRLAADFENFKKRARQEQTDTIQYASGRVVESLLPIIDDLERAVEHAPSGVDPGWLKGVELTLQKLRDVLEAHGVTSVESVGSKFDPALHEAIGSEESSDHPEDTVVTELRKGYRLRDRVLRPALVKVSRQPVHADSQDS